MRCATASGRWRLERLDRESAVIAAVELALVRLVEDFDLPEPDGATVREGLGTLRSTGPAAMRA